ncbi:YraN family protein [Thalassotalea piscium]
MRWIANNKAIKNNSNQNGQIAEETAKTFLQAQGLTYLEKNFHSRWGELDLIMKDQNVIVFVEVKFRKNNLFGGAISAVSRQKQQKIIKTSAIYLQHQGLNEYNTPYRFDVVAIEGNTDNIAKSPIIWLKNAFN